MEKWFCVPALYLNGEWIYSLKVFSVLLLSFPHENATEIWARKAYRVISSSPSWGRAVSYRMFFPVLSFNYLSLVNGKEMIIKSNTKKDSISTFNNSVLSQIWNSFSGLVPVLSHIQRMTSSFRHNNKRKKKNHNRWKESLDNCTHQLQIFISCPFCPS